METVAIFIGLVIIALLVAVLLEVQRTRHMIIRRENQMAKITLAQGMPRQSTMKTLRSSTPTPVVSYKNKEKRRSG